MDERIQQNIYLDAVITLVDAEHMMQQLDNHRVAVAQIGFADRLVVTKLDRVDLEKRDQVLNRLHQINQKAKILEASFGAISSDLWLGIKAFEMSNDLELGRVSFQLEEGNIITAKHFSLMTQKSWNDDIRSYLFEADSLDIDAIGEFMTRLVELYGNDMLRYKGILAITNEPRKLIVQGVYKVVGFDYGEEWQTSEKMISQLVVIGRNLPFDKLLKEFQAAENIG